jgi:hypothetical protein
VTGSACTGNKRPITVQTSHSLVLEFTVWGVQVHRSEGLTIELGSVGKDVFEGAIKSVGTIRVSRR